MPPFLSSPSCHRDLREEQLAQQIESSRLRFITHTLAFNILQGRHKLAGRHGLLINWQLNYAYTSRYEPDTRDLIYFQETPGDPYRFRNEPGSGERFYSEL